MSLLFSQDGELVIKRVLNPNCAVFVDEAVLFKREHEKSCYSGSLRDRKQTQPAHTQCDGRSDSGVRNRGIASVIENCTRFRDSEMI